ncbi:MAG: UDP-4-amino-4,6-dideoxy-N-acetyl-beta-L-altrosamine transaminase [Candidatus Hydrogenedentes bacterium]|nr:UDP-4-amino-4,6-dideoxy-N-acetyl-beta-L-altrosamine transaminase [Candidatus Hydrogenedentota bacterium]
MREGLAINGGAPVRTNLLPYGHQVIDDVDIHAVIKVLRGEWLTTGPTVEAYERAFADYVSAQHAIAFSSGTAALHAAVSAAGVGAGDEVITTPMTFAATANAALYCGARPVFADVQGDTGNIDPDAVESCMTSKTRAILPVDYAGQPADLDALAAIAERHGVPVIEDAAHALGAKRRRQRVGAISTMTIFSTHPVKHITTGEGGMVTTNDTGLAQRLRAFRNHGITTDARTRGERGDWFYEMVLLGYNYRIPDILCALGLSQLAKLDRWLARRRDIAEWYTMAFQEVPEVRPLTIRPECESAWHLYPILLDTDRLAADRATVFKALRAEGIGVNVHYIPVYWHPYYRDLGYSRGLCPVAERMYEQLLTLPLWAGMTDADAADVIAAVRKVVGVYRRT